MDMSKVLRPKDMAAELNITAGRVYALIREFQIPVMRLGRTILISRRAWEEWLASLGAKPGHQLASMPRPDHFGMLEARSPRRGKSLRRGKDRATPHRSGG